MKIITVSREFGSGGRELGKRLADILSWDYYDSEIITAIASKSGLDKQYIENTLNNGSWHSYPITFHATLTPSHQQISRISLLVDQEKVIREIAASGRDCIIVGRDADVILAEYHPFNIFVCADTEAKVKRCQERAPAGEQISERDILREMKQIDRGRAQTRSFLSSTAWGDRANYHLVVNTTGWNMKVLAPAVAAFAQAWFQENP